MLQNYIPETAVDYVLQLLQTENVLVKVTKERKTKHGDYKPLPHKGHQITVNANLNEYRFLITLVHEIAHLKAFNVCGRNIKPHGKEWKHTFKQLMLPLIRPEVFPNNLLPLLAKHFKNPKASSDTDTKLAYALKQFDAPNDKTFIFEVPEGAIFKIHNGRVFKKGSKRRKRFECQELSTRKVYLFNPNAEVDVLEGV